MKIITRTVWGSSLQSSLLLGKPHQILTNTTLNEKFQVQSGTPLPAGKSPILQYLCIGDGGHRNRTSADGRPFTSPINHRATDAACFSHIPFILREVTNDLTLTERSKYGLRVKETHGGRNYFAYYLKRMNLANVVTELLHTTVQDGIPAPVPFVPTSANLNPQPPEMPNTGVITTSGNYISVSSLIPLLFSESDVAELIEVAKILYDNEYMAVISEIGLCSGVDLQTTGPGPGNEVISYTEAVGVQVATFITAYYSMGFTNKGFDFEVEVGATEPLLSEADYVTAQYLNP